MGPNIPSRFELPLLGSNQDSPDPESGVLPVTPRGTVYYGALGVGRGKDARSQRPTPHAFRVQYSVELRGLEPLTSWVRSRRSPS